MKHEHETMDDAMMLSSRRCIRAIDDDDPDLMAGPVESIVAKVQQDRSQKPG